MTRAIVKLSFAGLRSRALPSALTALVVAAATATLTIALLVDHATESPWERTFAAARGAHVLVLSQSEDIGGIADLPGVESATGPIPLALTSFVRDGRTFGLRIAGLPPNPAVDRPIITDGEWLAPNGIVLERSLARTIGVEPGEKLRLVTPTGELSLAVSGLAVSSSQERYPDSQPGLGWVTQPTLARIAPNRDAWGWLEAVRLADPASAPAFAAHVTSLSPAGAVVVETWQERRAEVAADTRTTAIVVSTFAVLLLVVACIVCVTTIGARVLQQHREIGLAKVVGFTPSQIAAVFLVEYVVLALIGAGIGLGAGTAVAPLLVSPAAEVVGAADVSADPLRLALSGLVIVAAVAAVVVVATWRGARFSTLQALGAGGAAAGCVHPRRLLGRLALPLPVGLGAKDALARPLRTWLLILSVALTVAAVVAALAMEATLGLEDARAQAAPSAAVPAPDPVAVPDATREELRPLVHSLSAVLLVVAATNVLAVALLAVRERVRTIAVLRAIGLTPGQVTASLLFGHALAGLVAGIVGIPFGVVLFLGIYQLTNGTTTTAALPPWWWLALVPVATLALVGLLVGRSAARAARKPVAEGLRFE